MVWKDVKLNDYVAKVNAEAKDGAVSIAGLIKAFNGVEAFSQLANETSIIRQLVASSYIQHESTQPNAAPEAHFI